MNTGQSLFSIGALLILSLTVLRVNNSILITDSILQDAKLGVLATSTATSLMEEASEKAFDENTVNSAVLDVSALSASLGYNTGEIPQNADTFDDFDDYNGYIKRDTINTVDFKLVCAVNYINPSNVDGTTTQKTWHKKITITITSSFFKDPMTFSSVYSYWQFR